MSDNRKKVDKPKKEIMKILIKKTLQAKDLRMSLKKRGIKYSRDRLNDLLNQMMDSGDIERKIQDNNPYPVYAVRGTSKLLAEFNGIQFGGMFEYGMFKRYQELLNEFESSKHKKTKLDALLQFFGFFVLGSLLASRLYDKKLRSDWLRPVLDLEKNKSISTFFEGLVHEDKLVYMVKELSKKYPDNTWTLGNAVKATKSMKELVGSKDDVKGLEKMFKVFVDEYNN